MIPTGDNLSLVDSIFILLTRFKTLHLKGALMQKQITRRNFRQEYNLLRVECEEVRLQNLRLKNELMKLIFMMSNRDITPIQKIC